MEPDAAREKLSSARTGHLATIRPDGAPHVVVVTLALLGESVVTAIDHKPKTTTDLQRLRNVVANPRASLIVDGYDEDWSKLWWVRVDGPASVLSSGDDWENARMALVAKYRQYVDRPPQGDVISIAIERVSSWGTV